MRGSCVKLKSFTKASNVLIQQNNRMQMKEQVLNIRSKTKKVANMLYQAHTNCPKQASFANMVIIQLEVTVLSEGVMITNFIPNLWNSSNY